MKLAHFARDSASAFFISQRQPVLCNENGAMGVACTGRLWKVRQCRKNSLSLRAHGLK